MAGFRWAVVVVGLLLGSLVQDAAGRADFQPQAASDPPDAVGRVAVMSGTVLFRADAAQSAVPALLNYPLSLGNVVETAPEAQATIDIAAGRFYLDGATRLRIGALADGSSVVSLDQGALVLHVLEGGAGQVFTVETAKGTLRVDQSGYYEVEAGVGSRPMTVSALEGGAQFRTPDQGERVLHPGERISLIGVSAQSGAVVEDDLVRRVAAEIDQIGENHAAAPEHVSSQVTGFQDLARYGLWELTEAYGPVWRPQVGSGWAPYSRGHWVEVAPWGKTWIDDAPWGFAPFHYGRWINLNQGWAWLPGETAAPPVYAPALVSFFDTPADKGVARRWIPLGPEEPYLPPYRVSIVYFRAINAPALPAVVKITKITNIVQITNVVQIVNRRPVLILGRLVNRPGGPPPKPKPSGQGSAMVSTQPSQTVPPMRALGPEVSIEYGSTPFVAPLQAYSIDQSQPQHFLVQPQPQRPIVIIRNQPPTSPGGGGGGSVPPIVVPRTLPTGASNPTLGTGVGLGTQSTTARPPAVTFGGSPGANGVTFGGGVSP